MSYVPQLDNVFQSLTVDENLEMGALDQGDAKERRSRRCTSSSPGSASAAPRPPGR